MTRTEAYKAMQEGKEIQHTYFSDGEYLYLINDTIRAEDGVDFTTTFWKTNLYQDGWSIFED